MEHDFIVITSDNQLGTRDKLAQKFNGILDNLINSSAGRAKLAASMVQPIRRNLDYQGSARRALLVDSLPTGALPIYDINKFQHDEVVITSDNKIGTHTKFSAIFSRVTIPTFEVYSTPTIKLGDVKARRFNLIDRNIGTGGTSV